MIESLEKKSPTQRMPRRKPPLPKQDNGAPSFGGRKKTGLLTIADVEKMSIARPFELVNGRIVEKMPNGIHGQLQAALILELGIYLKSKPVGSVFGEVNYRLDPKNEHESKAPDASFIRAEKIPTKLDKFLAVAPDLAIEIVSPTDAADDVFDKAGYYLAYGVKEVWLVFSRAKMVVVYDSAGIRKTDTTLATPLLPGFELNVKALFTAQA